MKRPVHFAAMESRGRAAIGNGAGLVNLFAQVAPPGATSDYVLHGTPGTTLFADLSTDNGVQGLHLFNDIVYAVTSKALYAVNQAGVVTEIDQIPVSGRCSMANNGQHMLFVDGVRGWTYDGTTLDEIGDPAFYAADTVQFMDGYFILNRKGTGQFFISGQDAITFDGTDIAEAESQNDKLLGILQDHRELWMGGEKSIEVYYNRGDADFPFQRVAGAVIEHGIASPHAMTKADNAVYTLSDEGIAYEHRGIAPRRISTHEIESAITNEDLSTAAAFAWYDEGHTFVQWSLGTKTVVYDVATGLWHLRQHIDHGRHHANCYVRAYGKHLVGDYQTGKIYVQSLTIYEDAGRPMVSLAESVPIFSHRERARHWSFEVRGQSGVGLTTGQGSDPAIMMQFSDDSGASWSSERWGTLGAKGKRGVRQEWRRLGQSRERRYRVAISDPVQRAILSTAYAEVTP